MTETPKVCPLIVAIGDIRTGGFYSDDAEDLDNAVVCVGGGDTEYVCDDTSYYLNLRMIEIARFELAKPDLEKCRAKFERMYGWLQGKTREQLYRKLIDDSQMKRLLYRQFLSLVEAIVRLEDLISVKVIEHSRKGKPINVTIPDIMLLPHIDTQIIYEPAVLTKTMNAILGYMDKLNIGSMLSGPIGETFELVPDFAPTHIPNFKDIAPKLRAPLGSPEQYINEMKILLSFETETTKYIQELERYHCLVINHVNKVHRVMKKIIELI